MKVFIVSENCPEPVLKMLDMKGKVLKLGPNPNLMDAESCHPDMQILRTGNSSFIYAKGFDNHILDELKSFGIKGTEGSTDLYYKYPQNTPYNALIAGDYIIANIRNVSHDIASFAVNTGFKMIHIKQGYAACTSLYINKLNMIITGDVGVKKALSKYDYKIEFLDTKGKIKLPGFNEGFIGGAGLYDPIDDAVYFAGNVEKTFPDLYRKLKEAGINVYFADCEMTDIGGIQVFTI